MMLLVMTLLYIKRKLKLTTLLKGIVKNYNTAIVVLPLATITFSSPSR